MANASDVRVVYWHLPLGEIPGHETSKAAAALSEIAGERGKFWQFARAIHTHHGQMTRVEYLDVMHSLGFSAAAVEERLDTENDDAITRVQRDVALAERLGVRATPTFIVQIGLHPLVSATQRGLLNILNSESVRAVIGERRRAHAMNSATAAR